VKALSFLVGRDLRPSLDEYQAITRDLNAGDPLMDDYVVWMFGHDPKRGKQMFDMALHEGIAAVTDAPEALVALFGTVEQDPVWLDRDMLECAVAFIHSTGNNSQLVLRDLALMGGYLLSGFNQALVMTGALTKGSSKRMAETYKWWIDCTDPQGLLPQRAGYRSTIHVRLIHALVRRHLATKAEWDQSHWGLPISQTDMAATNLAFGVLYLTGLRALGIWPTAYEARAVLHFWKYTGWLMGVDECWLVDEERQGWVLMYHTMLTQSQPDWTSKELGRALADEPLSRPPVKDQGLVTYYLTLARQHFDYQKHLSTSCYFLNRTQMQSLGLPAKVWPWYPLLRTPWNLAETSIRRSLPILKLRQRAGRQEQLDILAAYGIDGQYISPDQSHPAHM